VIRLLRDQAVNAVVALLGGVSALGVWNWAYRTIQIPLLLFTSLWRVSYLGMASLVEAEEDVGETIGRVVEVAAVFAGLILAPLVAATPAWVPILFGRQWTDVVPVILPACFYLMVGTPLMFAVLVPLMTVIGVPAVSYGWAAAGVGEAIVLILAARKHAEFSIRPGLLPPTVAAVGAGAVGWVVGSEVGVSIVGGLVGGLFAAGAYLAALWLWHRSSVLDCLHLSLRGLRYALARSV
jgi:hypothetical protein